MYAAPVFVDLTFPEYQRIMSAGSELLPEPERHKREDVASLKASIEIMRDCVLRHQYQAQLLEGRIILARRKLRMMQRYETNAGWPLVDRRMHSRGSGRR